MRHFNIVVDDEPCWYELGWEKQGPALILRVHNDFIRHVRSVPASAPIVTHFKEKFKFGSFSDDFSGDFGFEGAFIRRGEENGFTVFAIPMPKVKVITDEPCRSCKGSGESEFGDGVCLLCSGTKKRDKYVWHEAYAISATYTFFSNIALFPEQQTICQAPQLMTLQTMTEYDMHGGSLGGTYGKHVTAFLSTHGPHTALPYMIDAMKAAYDAMIGLREFDKHSFLADVAYENGWLNVSCPGDACGLHPSHYGTEKGRGYEFSCHNVDNPAQQITLLAGLGALHDVVRDSM